MSKTKDLSGFGDAAWQIGKPRGGVILAVLLSKEAGLGPDVARLQLTRVDFHGEAVGPVQRESILAAAPILKTSGKLAAGADIEKAGATLVNTRFTDALGLH